MRYIECAVEQIRASYFPHSHSARLPLLSVWPLKLKISSSERCQALSLVLSSHIAYYRIKLPLLLRALMTKHPPPSTALYTPKSAAAAAAAAAVISTLGGVVVEEEERAHTIPHTDIRSDKTHKPAHPPSY